MSMWLHFMMRALISIVVGVGVFVLFVISSALWDSALLAGWDAGILTWLILGHQKQWTRKPE